MRRSIGDSRSIRPRAGRPTVGLFAPGRPSGLAYRTDADLVEGGGTPDVEWWRRALFATEHVRAVHERHGYVSLPQPEVFSAGSSVLRPAAAGAGWPRVTPR